MMGLERSCPAILPYVLTKKKQMIRQVAAWKIAQGGHAGSSNVTTSGA